MKVNEIFNKKRIIAFVMAFAMVVTSLSGISFASKADELDDTTPVYRLYNTNTSDHFLTVSEEQRDQAVSNYGYTYEKVAYNVPVNSSTPVYSMVCPGTSEHIYSMDLNDLQSWCAAHPEYYMQDGGKPVFYSADALTGTAVYQFFNTNQTADKASHMFVTEGSDDYNTLVAWGWQNDGIKFYASSEAPVEELEIVATQSGSSKVTVVSNMPLTYFDDIDLYRGTIEQSTVVEISDDGMTATLTTDVPLADAEYTVVVTPEDETIAPASDSFDGEKAELTSIGFLGDGFILNDLEGTGGFVPLRGFNQFGEMQILEDGAVQPYVAPSDTATYSKPGGGVILATQAQGVPYVLGNTVSVTAVYQKGTTVLQCTGNLTVVSRRTLGAVEFGEITTDNLDYQGKRITPDSLTDGKYYIPVTAVDQYGIPFDASTLNNYVGGQIIIVTPDSNQDQKGFVEFTQFDELSDGTVVMRVKAGSLGIPGTQTISMISVGGITASTEVTVEDNRFIDELTVTFPELYSGVKATVPFGAVDQYGDPFTAEELYKMYVQGGSITNNNPGTTVNFGDQNSLTKQGTKLTASKGDFVMVKNAAKKTLTLTFTPEASLTQSAMEMVTIQTATPEVTTLTLTVNAEAHPEAVKGINPSVNTVIGGNNRSVDLGTPKNIQFTNTNGEIIEGSKGVEYGTATNDKGYFYLVAPKRITATTMSALGVVEQDAQQNTGTDTYTIYLKQRDDTDGDTVVDYKDVKVTVSDEQYKSYTASLENALQMPKTNLYTGKTGADIAVLKVKGKDAQGNEVSLSPRIGGRDGYRAVLRNSSVADATLTVMTNPNDAKTSILMVTSENEFDDIAETGTAYVDIYAYNTNSGVDELVTTVEVACTNEDPTPFMFVGVKTTYGAQADMGDLTKALSTTFINLDTGITTLANARMDYMTQGSVAAVTVADAGNADDNYPLYLITALDQYGMGTVGSALWNGTTLTQNQVVGTAGGNLSLSSGQTSVMVSVAGVN